MVRAVGDDVMHALECALQPGVVPLRGDSRMQMLSIELDAQIAVTGILSSNAIGFTLGRL